MAQRYVVQNGQPIEIEDNGEEYFYELLVGRSLFQEPEEDKYENGTVIGCKMHDLVHDLAKFVSRSECTSFGMKTQIRTSTSRIFVIAG